jgi:hypothetical protein
MKRSPDPRLLTQTQAAAYCGVCVEVFKKACPIPPIALCDRIPRYDRQALDRWIDSLDNSRPYESGGDLGAMWDNAGNGGSRAGN